MPGKWGSFRRTVSALVPTNPCCCRAEIRPAVHKSREEEWEGMRRGVDSPQLQWKSFRFPSERESKSDTRLVVQESV